MQLYNMNKSNLLIVDANYVNIHNYLLRIISIFTYQMYAKLYQSIKGFVSYDL